MGVLKLGWDAVTHWCSENISTGKKIEVYFVAFKKNEKVALLRIVQAEFDEAIQKALLQSLHEAKEKKEWKCPQCTFMNKITDSICSICQLEKPIAGKEKKEWKCPQCTFMNKI